MKADFRLISDERKGAMRQAIAEWRRSKGSTTVLIEGLRVLASPNRPTADSFMRDNDSKVVSVVCTYGKRYRSKLMLPKEDAAILLDVVTDIKAAAKTEYAARKMVVMAASILLDGEKPPATLTDPRWEPLLRVLSSFDPMVGQAPLF